MRTIYDENLIRRLEKYANEPHVKEVFDIFGIDNCYLLGGAVRDSILDAYYDKHYPVRDIDILIHSDDRTYQKIKSKPGIVQNWYGNYKWKLPSGREIDIFPTSIYCQEFTIEEVIKNVNFTTSSAAYLFSEHKIIDYLCMESLSAWEIDLLNDHGDAPSNMARGMMHWHRFGFSIGPRMREWIKQNYNDETRTEIRSYLHYKKKSHLEPRIIAELERIHES